MPQISTYSLTIQGVGDSLIQSVVGDSRDRVLGRNPDKSVKSSPPCYTHSPLQLCLEIFISSNSHYLLQFLQCVSVHPKGERRKTCQKSTPPFHWFKKPIQKQEYVKKPQRNWMFMNSASVHIQRRVNYGYLCEFDAKFEMFFLMV